MFNYTVKSANIPQQIDAVYIYAISFLNLEFDINGTFDTPEKINNIEIRVWKPGTGDDGIALTAEKGKAACKILVDDSFEVVQEKLGIGDEYGLFSSYVQGGWDPIVGYKWWLKK